MNGAIIVYNGIMEITSIPLLKVLQSLIKESAIVLAPNITKLITK